MGAIATFDYGTWITRFPEFGQSGAQPISPAQAQAFFDEAAMYLRNDGGGPVVTVAAQTTLMNMVAAHIAALNGPGASGLVGRVSSASEGSVSVSVEFSPEEAAAWFGQTKYGAAFWQMTRQYRTARYIPGFRAGQGVGFNGIPGIGNIFPW